MNNSLKVAVLILATVATISVAQEHFALAPRSIQTRVSNDGSVKVQFNPDEHPEVHVWLSSGEAPDQRQPLGDKFFYVQDVSISPSNSWIVVKDGTASAGTSLVVFRRVTALEYKHIATVDPQTALPVLVAEKKITRNFEPAH